MTPALDSFSTDLKAALDAIAKAHDSAIAAGKVGSASVLNAMVIRCAAMLAGMSKA